jgi:hypothetical protein
MGFQSSYLRSIAHFVIERSAVERRAHDRTYTGLRPNAQHTIECIRACDRAQPRDRQHIKILYK